MTTLLNELPILHNYAQAFVVVVLRAAPQFDDVNTEKRRLWVLTNILALTQSRQSSLKIFASVVLDLSRQLPFIVNTKGANAIPAILLNLLYSTSLFGDLADKIEPEPLKAEMAIRIQAGASRNPSFSSTCIAYLTTVAVDLINRPLGVIPTHLDKVSELVTIPLTKEQEEGKQHLRSPALVRELLPSLLIPIIAMRSFTIL